MAFLNEETGERFEYAGEFDGKGEYRAEAKQNAKQALLRLIEEKVIGADEPRLRHDFDPDYDHEEEVDKETRNDFRAEQRSKLRELLGGMKT